VLKLIFKPQTVAKLFAYWRVIPGLAASFAARYAPKARFVVFGHSHHEGIWTIAHHTTINTGSYSIPGRPHAVVIENRTLGFYELKRTSAGYQLASKARKTFSLGDADPVEEMKLIYAAFPERATRGAGGDSNVGRAKSLGAVDGVAAGGQHQHKDN
jgi:hypothetical protein